MTTIQKHTGHSWKKTKKNADKDSNVNPVSEDRWYTYFKELDTSYNTSSENPLVDADLPNLEKNRTRL